MGILRHLAIGLLAGLFASQTASAEMELKFGHVGAPGSLFDISVNEFAKRANAKLAGKAVVRTFGSSQLGKDKELLQKLKLGTVDFALPSTVMSTVTDEFGLFEMPYLVQSRSHMSRIESEIFSLLWGPAASRAATMDRDPQIAAALRAMPQAALLLHDPEAYLAALTGGEDR